MRERAEAATPGQWLTQGSSDGSEWYVISRTHGQVTTGLHDEPGVSELVMIERDRADAEHIAGWGPEPALAVADVLEERARELDEMASGPYGSAGVAFVAGDFSGDVDPAVRLARLCLGTGDAR